MRNKHYYISIILFIVSLFISSISDIITIFLKISFVEIIFFRCFFSLITIILLTLLLKKRCIKTTIINIHIIRGILITLGLYLWIQGICKTRLSIASIVNFCNPVFTMIMAKTFLKENTISKSYILFISIFIVATTIIHMIKIQSFQGIISLFISTTIFVVIDIINKKNVSKDTTISVLFYSSLFPTLFLLPCIINNFQIPNKGTTLLLIILGILNNICIFLMLKSYEKIQISKLSYYKYMELMFTITLEYIFLDKIPNKDIIIVGITIILYSYIFIAKTK